MNSISQIMEHNRSFVEKKEYEAYISDKFPQKKMMIVTCMDTRLVELLPKAMNFKNGDVKIVKTAGAIISHPFGSAMRSVLVGLYELGAEEVVVVGHHECGMAALNSEAMLSHMVERGIDEKVLKTIDHAGIKLERWLRGFDNVSEGVMETVELIRNHPLLPPGTPVHGMIIDPKTGALDLVVDGYENQASL
ncbi:MULTISPECIES: carbonic anhydrase [unclassified Paenibacillus]|uniref:carbonic anhydrase n=1 Tax=Paenibacillus provencensis TaxID=441151 RepID=A0ABW3PKE9_9BACL|nr:MULTISPECIES: carbonic anhydrase [unclassified Paenibacillus]MCM3126647.1 carbonic anhydrase [Paenibacillus sp. MER 78]SFS58506.1 carbonic anhydrase [Paenibacillus sp. 453mf]